MRKLLIPTLSASLLLSSFFIGPSLPTAWATEAGSFTLLYSNDQRGELEPCG